jgi:protein-tyrosine phosphatase
MILRPATLIDLHCHILPNVDDGAASIGVSRAMFHAARDIGYTSIVATPHLLGYLDERYETHVQRSFEQILPIAEEFGISLQLGYEVRLTSGVVQRLRTNERYSIGCSRTVLVDLACAEFPHYVDDALFALQIAGFQPILAHPERYPDIQKRPEYGLLLAERGIALQVTIGSLAGAFGTRARKSAEDLLRMGAIHLVATDAHSAGHRMAAVPEGLRRLRKLLSREHYRRVTFDTPHALLSGQPLPDRVMSVEKRFLSRIF